MSREREGYFKREMEDGINYYDVLGVSQDASEDEIKSAYRKIAMQCHPDHNPGNMQMEKKFRDATGAYETLRDSSKRQVYDSKHGDTAVQSDNHSDIYKNLSPDVQEILRRSDVNMAEQLRKMGIRTGPSPEKLRKWKKEDDEADEKHQEKVRKLREEIDRLRKKN